jgi:hypothetical protein
VEDFASGFPEALKKAFISRYRARAFHVPDMEGGMNPDNTVAVESEIRRKTGLPREAALRPPQPRTFSKLIEAIGHLTR